VRPSFPLPPRFFLSSSDQRLSTHSTVRAAEERRQSSIEIRNTDKHDVSTIVALGKKAVQQYVFFSSLPFSVPMLGVFFPL
jgi:hypothetical protein